MRVKKDDDGLLCDKCAVWHHAKCEKVEEDVYEVLKRQKNMLWFCADCNPKVRENLKEMDKIKEENVEMKKQIHELKEHNDVMCRKMEDLEEKWNQRDLKREEDQGNLKAELRKWKSMNEEMKEHIQRFEEKMSERMEDTMKKVNETMREREEEMMRRVTERVFESMDERMEERQDRENRKKNVIMFNVTESGKSEAKEREAEDMEVCRYVFQDVLGVEKAHVEKVFRLGVRERGKDRPLVACLSDVYAKWNIIKMGKDLRNVRNETISKIRIAVDRTKREREEAALLREKLIQKRREGGRWIIKRGQIVKLTEERAFY